MFLESGEKMFWGLGEDLFWGLGKDLFWGLGEDLFQGLGEDLIQALGEDLFWGVIDAFRYISPARFIRWDSIYRFCRMKTFLVFLQLPLVDHLVHVQVHQVHSSSICSSINEIRSEQGIYGGHGQLFCVSNLLGYQLLEPRHLCLL